MPTTPAAMPPANRIPPWSPKPRTWLVLVGILLLAANTRAAIAALGPVLNLIREDLGLDATTASFLTSLPILVFAIAAPTSPKIAARLGLERTLGLSLALLAASIVLRSMPWIPGLWLGTAGLGLSIGIINVLVPALVKRDFSRRVTLVSGLYSAVQGAGAALASGFAVPLAGASPEGWRIALGVWAGAALLGFAFFLPQLGHLSDPPSDSKKAQSQQELSRPAAFRSPWRSALGWQITFYMGLQSTIYYTVITWLPSIEQSNGTSPIVAGTHIFILQIATLLGSLAGGFVIPRFRDQRIPAIAATALSIIGVLGEIFAPGFAGLWAAAIGLCTGISVVVALSVFSLRAVNHGQAASVSSMAQTAGYVLAASGPILIGQLHDFSKAWTIPLLVLLALLAGQACFGYLSGKNRLIGVKSE